MPHRAPPLHPTTPTYLAAPVVVETRPLLGCSGARVVFFLAARSQRPRRKPAMDVPWRARRRSGADATGAVLDSITSTTTWLDSFSRLLACFLAMCSAVSQERLRCLDGVGWVLHLVAGGAARQAADRFRDHGRGVAQGDHGSDSASRQSSLTLPRLWWSTLFSPFLLFLSSLSLSLYSVTA